MSNFLHCYYTYVFACTGSGLHCWRIFIFSYAYALTFHKSLFWVPIWAAGVPISFWDSASDRDSLLDLSGMSNFPNMRWQSTCAYFQVLMWMAGDILRWNGSGQYIQGVFFNWCSPKIHKYGEKLMYQNWCPPKIHKYGENCPPKSAIGIPLRYQPPQSVLKMWGLVHWTTIATYSSTLK